MDTTRKVLWVLLFCIVLLFLGGELWSIWYIRIRSQNRILPGKPHAPRNLHRNQGNPPTTSNLQTYLHPPTGVTFVTPDGKPATLGFTSLSSDSTLLTFVGRVTNLAKQGTSLLAEIVTNDAKGQLVVRTVLLFDQSTRLPFNLQTQKTHDLFPTSNQYTMQQLTDSQHIQAALTPLLNTDVVMSLLLSLPSLPSPSSQDTQMTNQLQTLLPCNQSFSQEIQSAPSKTRPC